jgi:hypothetical protein
MSIIQNAGLVNSQNSHFSNPGFSSNVGGVSGCGGPLNSPNALKGTGMFNMVKTGGKKRKGKTLRRGNKSRRKQKHRGGNGYGFSKSQLPIAATSGVHGAHGAAFDKYENVGQNSDTNMGASSQSGGYGTGGYPYYAYKPTEGENLSLFAGSGYPPISRGLNSQCGGKRRTKRSTKNKRKVNKKKRTVKKRKNSKRRKTKVHKKRTHKQKGGYSQYMSNVANTHTYALGGQLNPANSALANPPPYTSTNDCLNTWKHLGDTPPYNEIMK